MASGAGMEMLSTSDFWKLILKKDRAPHVFDYCSRLGIDTRGLVMKNKRSAANAAIFGESVVSRRRPVMLELSLTKRRKGLRVRINIRGDRGHPGRVPLAISKDEERWPLTFTWTEGRE